MTTTTHTTITRALLLGAAGTTIAVAPLLAQWWAARNAATKPQTDPSVTVDLGALNAFAPPRGLQLGQLPEGEVGGLRPMDLVPAPRDETDVNDMSPQEMMRGAVEQRRKEQTALQSIMRMIVPNSEQVEFPVTIGTITYTMTIFPEVQRTDAAEEEENTPIGAVRSCRLGMLARAAEPKRTNAAEDQRPAFPSTPTIIQQCYTGWNI